MSDFKNLDRDDFEALLDALKTDDVAKGLEIIQRLAIFPSTKVSSDHLLVHPILYRSHYQILAIFLMSMCQLLHRLDRSDRTQSRFVNTSGNTNVTITTSHILSQLSIRPSIHSSFH